MNEVADATVFATRVVPLIEAVELNPRPDRRALNDDLEVSFVPMAAVEAATGRLDAAVVRRFGDVKKGYTAFREGDVLFAKITPCMENGKMAVARGLRNGVGCGSTEFHVLRPRPGVDSQYVYHFVSSARFRREAAHHMTGAVGQKRVPAAFLERCAIPLPDLNEQRRIVNELEKQLSRLDEAVANLKRVRLNLRRYERAVLEAGARGAAHAARVVTLGEVAFVTKLAGFEYTKFVRYDAGGDLAVIKAENAGHDGFKTTSFSRVQSETVATLTRSRLKAGDLFMVFVGAGTGRVARVPGDQPYFLGPNVALIRPAASEVDPKFLEYYLRSPTGFEAAFSFSKAVAQPSLSMGTIRAIPILLPPMDQQRCIVTEVDRRLSIVRDVDAEVSANLRRADAFRRATLAKSFAMSD